jgi:hypothetical protein
MPQTTTGARPTRVGERGDAGLAGQHRPLAHLGGAGGDVAQHPGRVAGLQGCGIVEVAGRPAHPLLPAGAPSGRRASSTSSTGMSSRTG